MDYITDKLVADIITQQMPLSEAFEGAQSVLARHGVHHGFGVAWGTGFQTTAPSTRYLTVTLGKASVSMTNNNPTASIAKLYAMAELLSSVQIDLEDPTINIPEVDANEYYLILRVTYTAASVNNFTGLVKNPGSNAPKFIIQAVSLDPGFQNSGLVIAKFCRASRRLVRMADSSVFSPDISSEKCGIDIPTSLRADSELSAINTLRLQLSSTHYHTIGKRLRLRNLSSAAAVNSAVMPLTGITANVATSSSAIAGWNMPLDWCNAGQTYIYYTAGIWKDVESFELLDSHFADSVQLAFHRTPGHDQVRKMVDAAPDFLGLESVIQPMTDYGVREMTLDFKGSVFEKDLTIDLVLDFTGYHNAFVFHLNIKNLRVKGKLTVNYGQSLLIVAGGVHGIIEFNDVLSFGDFEIRPWPQVTGVTGTLPITPAGSTPWYPWMAYVEFYANNAGNATFTGFTLGGVANPGPTLLNYWRIKSTGVVYTRGVIIPTYLHNAESGSGEFGPANPWLTEGTEGGLRLIKSTIPINPLGVSLYASGVFGGGDEAFDQIKIQLVKCIWFYFRPAGGTYNWKMLGRPGAAPVCDQVLTLYEWVNDDLYKQVFMHRLQVLEAISAEDLNASNSISAVNYGYLGQLDVGDLAFSVSWDGIMTALKGYFGSDVSVGGDLSVAGEMSVDGDIFPYGRIVQPTQGKYPFLTKHSNAKIFEEFTAPRTDTWGGPFTPKPVREWHFRGRYAPAAAHTLGTPARLLVHHEELENYFVGITPPSVDPYRFAAVDAKIAMNDYLNGDLQNFGRFRGFVPVPNTHFAPDGNYSQMLFALSSYGSGDIAAQKVYFASTLVTVGGYAIGLYFDLAGDLYLWHPGAAGAWRNFFYDIKISTEAP